MSDIKINVGLNSNAAKKGLTDLKGAIGGVGKGADNITGSFLKLAAAAGGIAAVTKGLTGIAQTGGQFEQLENSLNTVFGGLKEGNQAMTMATKIANDTGMSIESLAESMIQLKGAGVEPTIEQLTAFADAAAVSKDAAGAFDAAVSLVSRTTAGGLGLEELERLGDRGIPVYEMLNKKLGITRTEISEVGKTAEGASRIVNALTEAMAEQFGGAALRNASTFNGVMNQMKNSITILQRSLFKAGFGDAFKEGAVMVKVFTESITSAVNNNSKGVATFLDNVQNTIGQVVRTFIIGAASMFDTFGPALAGIFNFMKEGINNLVQFANMMPEEFRAFGLIGFMMLGGKGKALVVIVAAAFDSIINLMSSMLTKLTPVMNFFIGLMNDVIFAVNKASALSNKYLNTDFKPIKLIEDIDEKIFEPSKLKDGLANIVSMITGEVDQIPLIGEAGNMTAKENATIFLDDLLAKYNATMEKIKAAGGLTLVPGEGDGEGDSSGGFKGGFKTAFDKFKTNVNDAKSYGETIFNTMTDGFTDAIMTFVETGKLSFKDLFKSLMTEIIKMQANKMFLALFGGAQSFFSGLFMDKGGYIPGGSFGIVGEKGPEIVNGPARVTGRMETARQLGGMGGGSQNITYNISAVDVQSFRQALARDPQYIYNLTRVGQRRMPA